MKLTINIDEEKIMELAKTASMNELPFSIFNTAKAEAVGIAVKEIKDKLAGKPYFDSKESLYPEVKEFVYKQIEISIQELIEKKFSEKEIEFIIEKHAEKTIMDWLENKIYARLEELKKDIFFGSYNERKAEAELEEAKQGNN